MEYQKNQIREKLDLNKKIIALALTPAKDLSAFYEGLLPFLTGVTKKGYEIIFLTIDNPCNAIAYLKKEGFSNIFICPPEQYRELDFIDCFIVWDYCSYEWEFPELSKVVILQHYFNFYSPAEIASTFGYRTDYSVLIRGSKEEFVKNSKDIETAASLTFPFRMLKKKGCLIPGGYPEIDALYNNYHPSMDSKCITLCTTGAINNDRLLSEYGQQIISALLDSFPGYTIFFRPTPSDRGLDYVHSIEKTFGGCNNFHIDTGDLQDTINRTQVLISDCTGLKEVFTITTSIPYIYCDFSNGKKYIEKSPLGYKITNFEYMVPLVKQILMGERISKAEIDSCLVNLGSFSHYFLENIEDILEDRENPGWFYYENKRGRGQKEIEKPEDYFPYIQAFICYNTMRSLSLRIINEALKDFPDSVFLLGIKSKLHFYLEEYDMARLYLARANVISPSDTAKTINIVICENKGLKQLFLEMCNLVKKRDLLVIVKKSKNLLKQSFMM